MAEAAMELETGAFQREQAVQRLDQEICQLREQLQQIQEKKTSGRRPDG